MNFLEKYFAKAAGLEKVSAKQDVRCKVSLVASHDVTGPMAIQQFKEIGVKSVFDKSRVIFVADHIYPAATVQAKKMQWILRDFALESGCMFMTAGKALSIRLYMNLTCLKKTKFLLQRTLTHALPADTALSV